MRYLFPLLTLLMALAGLFQTHAHTVAGSLSQDFEPHLVVLPCSEQTSRDSLRSTSDPTHGTDVEACPSGLTPIVPLAGGRSTGPLKGPPHLLRLWASCPPARAPPVSLLV